MSTVNFSLRLCRVFIEDSREETYFYLVDLLPVSESIYQRNLKIICQGKVCITDKPLSLSIETR